VGDESSVLINAGPDFLAQVDLLPRPSAGQSRHSPVAAVLLTNADLDHVLGLISMREGPALHAYATDAVRQSLSKAFSIDSLLRSFTDLQWHEVHPTECFRIGALPHLEFRAIFLPATAPFFDRLNDAATGHSIAYEVHDLTTGKRLVVAPDVGEITDELRTALNTADAVLFDGTFWSDDELQRIKSGARTSRAMGHIPIADGSLDLLRSLKATHKSYFHINNTNPILNPASPERSLVESAGIRVEEDGAEWTL
jgi:pyrroloquinoline quinone biosynthesis protein B